jgi:hypothetical protein
MASPAALPAAAIIVMTAAIVVTTAAEAVTTAIIVVSVAPGKAKTPFRLCIIHRSGSNINRLLADVNGLRAGVNNTLKNGNGPVNVNRLRCGLKRDTDTDIAAAVSRY